MTVNNFDSVQSQIPFVEVHTAPWTHCLFSSRAWWLHFVVFSVSVHLRLKAWYACAFYVCTVLFYDHLLYLCTIYLLGIFVSEFHLSIYVVWISGFVFRFILPFSRFCFSVSLLFGRFVFLPFCLSAFGGKHSFGAGWFMLGIHATTCS